MKIKALFFVKKQGFFYKTAEKSLTILSVHYIISKCINTYIIMYARESAEESYY